MLDFLLYIVSGAVVGLAIGLTGVGGGSLMTPLLMTMGFPYNIAIGTDLLYASITKSYGVVTHSRQKTVDWRLVKVLAAGSIPASLLTTLYLRDFFSHAGEYESVMTTSLGMMLILTAAVILARRFLPSRETTRFGRLSISSRSKDVIIFTGGILLGVFVTLTSVGAGALCAAMLITLYPKLAATKIVGTDITHAVPLTLIAGLGHWLWLGNVDFLLLGCLLIGSLPAIHFGSRLSVKIPNTVLQPILGVLLLGMGIRLAI